MTPLRQRMLEDMQVRNFSRGTQAVYLLQQVSLFARKFGYVNGRAMRESTGTEKEAEAKRFLRLREGAVAGGSPITPRIDRILYDEVAADLQAYYQATGRWKNLGELERGLRHLDRFFHGRRAMSITPDLVLRYITERQATKTHLGGFTSNATINREMALLRRMLRLAARHGKVQRVPPFELLKEAPPRAGFFEADRYEAVRRHLPEDLRVAIAFAYTYGWRMRSEVLTYRGAESRERRRAPVGRDEDHRPQDRERLSTVCDRQRR